MIAPVLAGETLRRLVFQARVVTKPLKNPLIGWWCEHYFFYVKLRDLDDRDAITAALINPNNSLSSLHSAASTYTYHAASSVDWVKLCLKRVVEEFFRNEGETWDGFTIDSVPVASIGQSSWLDSVTTQAEETAADPVLTVGGDGSITGQEITDVLRQYQLAMQAGLTDMSFEDYIGQFGVNVPQAEIPHMPELIRYSRDWTYPSNTIDPATGAPSSACSWAIAERADKRRFFKEPGFILGVTVTRPKVYLSNQKSTATAMLDDALSWLPPGVRADIHASLKDYAGLSGPLSATTNGYFVDVADLFMYGEQFVNFALTATDAGMVALPTAALQKRYADGTMADALFSSAVSPANQVWQDGVAELGIASAVRDQTPTA